MQLQDAIRNIMTNTDLQRSDMQAVMTTIMRGEATPAQIGALLVALAMKGETVEEITGAVTVMREFAQKVSVDGNSVVDTVGTGGDGAGLFNVSTTSALITAAAGGRVAKHGNRAMSGSSGAADLLEQAGVFLDLDCDQLAQCIDQAGICFMFAPNHHGATRHAVGPRREIGVRNMFNLLGPLTNPAGALRQLVGVYQQRWLRPVAEVLQTLGSQHVLVVHSDEGLDEISLAGVTHVAELNQGEISEYTITPEQLGIKAQPIDPLIVNSAAGSYDIVSSVLQGIDGPASDMVALNAGATIYAADLEPSLRQGVDRAREVIASGVGMEKLHALATFTQQFNVEDHESD